MSAGDIVLAGKKFGVGSSRPVAALIAELGVAGLVAEEFNSLFFRNAVNAGLPAMTLPDATTIFSDGDVGTFDLSDGNWRLPSWGTCCDPAPSRCAALGVTRDGPDRPRGMPLLGKLLRRFRAGEDRSPLARSDTPVPSRLTSQAPHQRRCDPAEARWKRRR